MIKFKRGFGGVGDFMSGNGYVWKNWLVREERDASGPVHLRENRYPWVAYLGGRRVRAFRTLADAREHIEDVDPRAKAQRGNVPKLNPVKREKALSPQQIRALLHIYEHSEVARRGDRAYTVDVEVRQVGTRTAERLRALGLIETSVDSGSNMVRIGGFAGHSGYRRDYFTNMRAKLTPRGVEIARQLRGTR